MSVQSMEEMGKDFCPNVLQPFLENIDRKCQSSPSAVARTLEYLEGVPS